MNDVDVDWLLGAGEGSIASRTKPPGGGDDGPPDIFARVRVDI